MALEKVARRYKLKMKNTQTNELSHTMIKIAHKKTASVNTDLFELRQEVATFWMTLNYSLITFHVKLKCLYLVENGRLICLRLGICEQITDFPFFICFRWNWFVCVLSCHKCPANIFALYSTGDSDRFEKIVSRFYLIGFNIVNLLGLGCNLTEKKFHSVAKSFCCNIWFAWRSTVCCLGVGHILIDSFMYWLHAQRLWAQRKKMLRQIGRDSDL